MSQAAKTAPRPAATSGKQVASTAKLRIPAGKATPSPPVGPIIGQRGINIMEFCKQFNDLTKTCPADWIMTVHLEVYTDKTFSLDVKSPSVSFFLKKAAKIDKGIAKTGFGQFVGKITRAQLAEIAEIKAQDMNAYTPEARMSMIEGSARSMGLEIVD